MSSDNPRSFDLEGIIGYVLLAGVLLSMVLIIAGLILNVIKTGGLEARYVLKGENLTGFVATTVRPIIHGSVGAHTILNLGICTLLLTPFVRVFVSVFYFAIDERNWKYTIFTSIVLGVLTYSLFLR